MQEVIRKAPGELMGRTETMGLEKSLVRDNGIRQTAGPKQWAHLNHESETTDCMDGQRLHNYKSGKGRMNNYNWSRPTQQFVF
jgi:hypothetical protein